MTNGDRIRQMSNEELARTMAYDCDYCMQGEYCETSGVEGIKAYLESEVE